MTEVLDASALTLSGVVETTHGPVRGFVEAGIEVFKGVRYGAPPVGRFRFQPPKAPAPWRDVVPAVSLGAPAIQSAVPPGGLTGGRGAGDPPAPGQPPTDEDCLFLNVWTPGAGRLAARPVMVWLHGGGFGAGSGGAAMYDGAALARRGDVVTVTVNHRLNVFGYLNLAGLGGHPSSGVAGMLDLVLALEWVRDNIGAFGGDPGDVTIFGESGGGWKVSLLMAMPGARGLFHKGVIQSGPGLRAVAADRAAEAARGLLAELGVSPGDLGALETMPAAAIQAAALKVSPDNLMGAFAPSLDGVALPADPFHPAAPAISADIPLMIGTNKDETTLFQFSDPKFGHLTDADLERRAKAMVGDKADSLIAALRIQYPDYSPTYLSCAVQTVSMFWMNSVRLAERKAAQGRAPVYMYRLDWETPAARGTLKSPHAVEIPLVFDNVEAARSFVGRGEAPQTMADLMAPAWLAFARTGNPNTPELPDWPAYEASKRATMVFNLEPRVERDPMAEVRRVMEG
jgi:para-nitrobenzyl esterase